MPHQCVHCSQLYDDGSEEVLKECSQCGSKFFFYITQEKFDKLKESNEEEIELTSSEKKQIEKDVRDIVGAEDDDGAPIILDFESVKIIKPGKYLLDIHNLFNKERPLVYKLEDGKYVVDLTAQMGRHRRE